MFAKPRMNPALAAALLFALVLAAPVQALTTMYKELYEELAVTITAPLSSFVLEILPCGKYRRNLLVVCGIKGLVADLFKAVPELTDAVKQARADR